MQIKKFKDNDLNQKVIEDIDTLVERLEYMKQFIITNIKEDDLDFYKNIVRVHTDIQLLSGKLKHK